MSDVEPPPPSPEPPPSPRVEGYVDTCDRTHVAGWCWSPDRPAEPLDLVVSQGGRELGRTVADKFRRDLLLAGKGDGRHGYRLDLPRELLSAAPGSRISVRLKDGGRELSGSPAPVSDLIQEMILTPAVFAGFAEGPPLRFRALRIDIANTCNLSCVYCPTIALRTKERVDLDAFRSFLARRVAGVEQLSIGCGQEPTVSPALCDFLEAVAESPAPPSEDLILVTNGTLLHRHDWSRFAKAGLSALFVSLDSVDPEVLGDVRRGSELSRIEENITGVLAAVEGLKLHLNIVVTKRNLAHVDEVIEWGWRRGAATITLREMYFPPTTEVADQALFGLMVEEGAFASLRERLVERWGEERFCFADRLHLEEEYAYWAPKLV